jgi:hypothetical protein
MPKNKAPNKKKSYIENCIFCENKANSKEHIFPDWLTAYLGRAFISNKHHVNLKRYGQIIKKGVGKLNRQGDPYSQRLKIVCEPCNNTWMSQIVELSKHDLLRLLSAPWNAVSSAEKLTLRNLAVLMTMVVEYADLDTAVIPLEDRLAFKDRRGLRKGWAVWVGRISDSPTMRGFWHTAGTSELIEASNGIPKQDIYQITSLVVGNVFFVTFLTNNSRYTLTNTFIRAAQQHLVCLWPVTQDFRGVPPPILTNAEYRDLGDVLRSEIFPSYDGYDAAIR